MPIFRSGSGPETAARPPSVSFTHTVDGTTVQLTNTTDDSGAAIVAYVWDLGDLTRVTHTTKSSLGHTYRSQGPGSVFRVELTAINSRGEAYSFVDYVTTETTQPAAREVEGIVKPGVPFFIDDIFIEMDEWSSWSGVDLTVDWTAAP